MDRPSYRGRFAPTPSGPLHAGSVVAALASWLDARAHRGRWLVRIEDTDTPRCVPGADRVILDQLGALGLVPDEPVVRQSHRSAHYADALERLKADACAYPCRCSRRDVQAALEQRGVPKERHAMAVYPGTCRATPVQPLAAHAWRLAVPERHVQRWTDRRLGPQQQDVSAEVGDFVIRRADGLWAYQLAVVVDDALQGVTDVVRGEDLADNTARQILLQDRLGLPTPEYLHTPLVRAADGQKLSKQTGAAAIDSSKPLRVLVDAAQVLDLGLPAPSSGTGESVAGWLERATVAWGRRWLQD